MSSNVAYTAPAFALAFAAAAACSPNPAPSSADASDDGSLDAGVVVDASDAAAPVDATQEASVDAAPADAGTLSCTYWTRVDCKTQSAPSTETVKVSYWPPQNAPLDTTGSIAVSNSKGLELLSTGMKQWFLYPTDGTRKEYVGPMVNGVCGDAVLGSGTLTVTFSKTACQRAGVGCQQGDAPLIQVECSGVIGWP